MGKKVYTIEKSVSFSGMGIHTGEVVEMRFLPAPLGTGIRFRRVDQKGKPEIEALEKYVVETSRSTTIGNGGHVVHTVEHVLSAVFASGIDNLMIEVSNVEPPIGDGSALPFMRMLKEAGKREQGGTITPRKLKEPVFVQEKDVTLIALPYPGYKISYTLSYPGVAPLESQFYSTEITEELFMKEIAPCRTFARYEEISYLIDNGLIKGGSLSNANIILGDAVLTKEGIRFSNEMARHKLLDIVGDLALVGFPFEAHIISIRSGHATNVALAKTLVQVFTSEGKA